MISTKDIPSGSGGGVSKTLQPGNTKLKINSIALEDWPFAEGAYQLKLDCEGVDLGEGFEGFFIDKDNESLGRHKGQVGRVRASQWAYQDKTINGSEIKRDLEIVKMLKYICEATGCLDWLEGQDGKHETIEGLVAQFNDDAPFAEKYLRVCVGGREYENKAGYTNYDLFFPKFTKAGIPFESADVDEMASRVLKYNEADHIVKKKKDKEVESFSADASAPSNFNL